ncbi:hypothetical protein QC589_02240 [Halomonas elongata]|uniref:hypothetical protein n=1 Tax=Halomonas elongata TaxID=2746 RepID=UPI0033481707
MNELAPVSFIGTFSQLVVNIGSPIDSDATGPLSSGDNHRARGEEVMRIDVAGDVSLLIGVEFFEFRLCHLDAGVDSYTKAFTTVYRSALS